MVAGVCFGLGEELNLLYSAFSINPTLMKVLSKVLFAVLLFSSVSAPVSAAITLTAWPTTSTVEIGSGARTASVGVEPSGLAWHSGLNKLLMVGDEGQLLSMNADGSSVTLYQVGGDLEDVTVVDPASNFVYLANEDGTIIKYDLSTRTVAQTWDINGLMPELNGAGMEGLTYAEGYFYAGYQYNGKVYVLDLSGTSVVKVKEFAGLSGSGYTDLSGLHYRDGYLYALYSSVMAVMDMNGEVKATYSVPGSDQEGLAFGADSNNDGDADMFIAEDSTGKVYAYDNFPIYGWAASTPEPEPTPTPVDPDSDGDGVVASSDCNDSDSSVSALKTYYVDADADGVGSSTSAQLCSATAPTGYATSSTDVYDTIPNAGVEVSNDKVDNDGDGLVDEHNTVALNGRHPYFGALDANTSASGKIIGYWGLRNGEIGVRYADWSVYRYQAFTKRTNTLTKVKLVSGTGYLTVTLSGKTVTLNGYTGVAK